MRYTQPQSGPAQIELGNLFSHELQVAIAASDATIFTNSVSGQQMTDPYSNSFNKVTRTKWGIGRSGSAAGSFQNKVVLNPTASRGRTTMMLLVRMKFDTSGTTSTFKMASAGEASGSWNMAELYYGNGNRFSGKCVNGTLLTSDTTYTPGECYAITFTNNGGAGRQRLYINGVKQTSEGTYTGTAIKKLDLAVVFTGPTNVDAYDVIGFHVWSDELSPEQVKQISNNPWQVFKSPQRVFKALIAGGLSFSYTGSGGIVFSGTLPNTRGRSVQPSGGLAYSGIASVFRGALRAVTGGLVLSGNAAVATSALQSRIINPIGGLLLAGSALVQRNLSRIPSGGLVLSGAASIQRSTGATIVVLGQINDVIWKKLRILGGVGTRNDMLNQNTYWRDKGAGISINQVEKDVLTSQGLTGALNEQEKDYWSNL